MDFLDVSPQFLKEFRKLDFVFCHINIFGDLYAKKYSFFFKFNIINFLIVVISFSQHLNL
jgi:hypothetical protein